MELSQLADRIIVYGTAALVGALGGTLLGNIITAAASGIARLWRKRHPKKEQ